MANPVVTIEGRLTSDPELRFTASGMALANFTLATNDRRKQGDEWVDSDPTFLRCTAFKQLAENVAESLVKGDLVVCQGKIKQREFTDKEGNNRTVFEVTADTVAASLRFATAKVTRASRGSEGGGATSRPSAPVDDPWASSGASTDDPPF